MKKIFGVALAVAMSFVIGQSAFAELKIGTLVPSVRVDEREVVFEDQTPVLDVSVNRTLVPVRGVFEAMDATVKWNAEKAKVTITSKDNLNRVELIINNPTMKVVEYTSLLTSKVTEVELETAPVIYNNRTMLPLRQICEAMYADVNWDSKTDTADIHSKQFKRYIAKKSEEKGSDYILKDEIVNMFITSDATDVNAGDMVDIYVNVKNTGLYEGTELCSGAVTIKYDDKNFEYVSAILLQDGEVRTDVEFTENTTYMKDSLKILYFVTGTPEDRGPKATDTQIVKITFRAKTDEGGSFSLTDRFHRDNGDCSLIYDDRKDLILVESYTDLYIDRTPITVK